ncbi:MAG: hypothetical protein J5I93_01640 [Pirellulaceae bacterium]|nr:hypothetical protein [Pirellulaceae bacterium]
MPFQPGAANNSTPPASPPAAQAHSSPTRLDKATDTAAQASPGKRHTTNARQTSGQPSSRQPPLLSLACRQCSPDAGGQPEQQAADAQDELRPQGGAGTGDEPTDCIGRTRWPQRCGVNCL